MTVHFSEEFSLLLASRSSRYVKSYISTVAHKETYLARKVTYLACEVTYLARKVTN